MPRVFPGRKNAVTKVIKQMGRSQNTFYREIEKHDIQISVHAYSDDFPSRQT